jgi:hypothetical protein
MDPISFVASLLALCGAVGQISRAVSAVHSGLWNADQEIDQAVKQVGVIQQVLGQLADLKASVNRAEVADIIESLRALVAEIEAAFPLDAKLSPLGRRVRWALKDKAVFNKLVSRLDTTWNLLNIVLQVERL